jgi:hypothetical protein
MNIEKVMQEYYVSQLKGVHETKPYPVESEHVTGNPYHPLNPEDLFGYILTAGYFILSLFPDQWFSLGRCLFSFDIRF